MVEYFYLCDRYAVRRPYRLERASRAVTFHGDIAQMVERLNGIQKVRGSIPLISTIRNLKRTTLSASRFRFFLFAVCLPNYLV